METTKTNNQKRTVKTINKQITNQIKWKSRLANLNSKLYDGATLEELELSDTEKDIFEKNKYKTRNKFGREFEMFGRKLKSTAERKIRALQNAKAELTVSALRDAILENIPGADSSEAFCFALEQARDFLKDPQESKEQTAEPVPAAG